MKLWTIIKKEYRQIVKKKSFLISTILTPLVMAAFFVVPMLLSKVGREEKTIEFEDYSGLVWQEFQARSQESTNVNDQLKLVFKETASSSEVQKKLIAEYEQQLKDKKTENVQLQLDPEYKRKILEKEINGMVFIPGNVKETRRVYFCALNISDFDTNRYISGTVQKILTEKILTEEQIDLNLVTEAIRDVDLGTFKVKKEGTTKLSSGMEYMMSIFMLTILMMTIMVYGQLIMRGIIEEKNNRIIEVLISSASPQVLFYSKIVGIGLAGLTQLGIWILLGAMFMGSTTFGVDPRVVSFLTPELAIYFVVFFLVGYFMYSILFSVVGAAVNTDQEAQQYSAPINYLMFIPFLIGFLVTQNPDTPVVIVLSLMPLFTPMLMFMRISVAVPDFAQIGLSIVISVLFTLFLAWLGAKIFRVGILMYGKKPSIKEIIRWSRHR